ncbi:MAG TPA: NAD+ synthase [Acidimicrobiales bacterium]|nr:NAD+ synthase [Acidimicrobiales bacterium]
MPSLRVALCQIDTVVGDLQGNVGRVLAALERAEAGGADVAVLPELAITGYPPEDLLLKPRFVADNAEALEKLAARTGRVAVVVGFVEEAEGRLHNAAAVCCDGAVQGVYRKRLLPNYSVFDEERYFEPGEGSMPVFDIAGVRCGVSVCEDAWPAHGPVAELGRAGAEVILNLNASPYYAGRLREREAMLAARAREAGCPIAYVNSVGGQDELVFDGGSLLVDADGTVAARAAQFVEDVLVVELGARGPLAVPLGREEEIHRALVVGTRDYVEKNGFREVVVGLSGGIDSSLVACIAVDALGPERVHGVSMPSRFSSAGSLDDARALAGNLGIDHRVVPIEPAHAALLDMLAPSFEGREPDLTEENIQSRVRGVVLMALSNKFGWLVLTTGNKSELAVGYSTLYGDTAGGFAVIKDVLKTDVYALARRCPAIPPAVLTKPPSAELRPDQRDDQNLPPYEVLDPILAAYVEQDRTAAELEEAGFEPALVRRIVGLVDRAEYKRRQSPPGVRVSRKAFGKDRRMPITNGYR